MSLVIVPTPSAPDGGYDFSFVESVVREIAIHLDQPSEHLVIVKSTVLPGDIRTIRSRVLKDLGDCPRLVYNPEFIALGEVVKNMQQPDLVLIGAENQLDGEITRDLVGSVVKNSPSYAFLTIEEAELAKVALNAYVTMKISFANLIGEASSRLGSSQPSRVLKALGEDTRIGAKYLSPGMGFGGPCFPRDNRALEKALRQLSLPGVLQQSVDALNDRVKDSLLEQVLLALEARDKRNDKVRVLFVGLSYKVGSPELVESQALSIAQEVHLNSNVSTYYFDPNVRDEDVSNLLPGSVRVDAEDELLNDKYDLIIRALPLVSSSTLRESLVADGAFFDPWA